MSSTSIISVRLIQDKLDYIRKLAEKLESRDYLAVN